MNIKVKKRDGLGKTAEIIINEKKIVTPNILFIHTKRFKAPNFADAILNNIDLNTDKPLLKFKEINFFENPIFELNNDTILKKIYQDIFVFLYSSQVYEQSKKFTDILINIQEKIRYNKLLFIPSIGNPSNFALLTYMGCDLFDSSQAIIAARNNEIFLSNEKYKLNELTEIPCSCPFCINKNNILDKMEFNDILNHNYIAMLNEIKLIRNEIINGNLRNLVEKRVKINPHLTSILRYLDMYHYSFLEKNIPVVSNQKINATTKESLNRPEIKRFQQRILNRYKKPDLAKILLLLPCSAKKPYSQSKTHRFFKRIISSSNNPNIIHEVIITSPVGLVPRELELVYPAANYDIPVTGVWDEDEKKMIKNILKKYLKINRYDKIIVHLPEEITTFIKDIIAKPIITCIDKPTSDDSLEKLLQTLDKISENYSFVKSQIRKNEDMKALASYQFGERIAEKLLENCSIKGKYPYLKIMENNTQIGMVTEQRGYISLSKNGAEKIHNLNSFYVEIFDDFKPKGSILAPGVKNADKEIRIGDEVIIVCNNILRGVGIAQINPYEMIESEYGEAVKIRHLI